MEQDNIYDPHKSRELAIHIAASSPDCSMERVAALMYFADARANRHLSHSITGDDYMQSRFGPTPVQPVTADQRHDQRRRRQRLYHHDLY